MSSAGHSGVVAPEQMSITERRAVIRDGESMLRLATTILEEDGQLRRDVQSVFRNLRDRMVRRELARIPIARLRDATGGRVRLGVLEKHGFRTVLDVLDTHPYRLNAVPGVGHTTAMQAVAAARQVADAVSDDLRVRIDLDPQDRTATRLLLALHRYGTVAGTVAPVRDTAQQLSTGLQVSLSKATMAGSRLRMFFSSERRHQSALLALAHVQRTLAWADGSGTADQLSRAVTALANPAAAPEAIWEDFAQRSVEYYNWLGEIVDLGLDARAAAGFLPQEIVDAVEEQKLDDRFCRVSLRGYQAFGARFALVQRRTILGDEMGLGKTIEAIAVLTHLRSLGSTHFLVVCPASVLVNWTREVQLRSTLRAHGLHGQERLEKARVWVRNGDVGVTTFDTLRRLDLPPELQLAAIVVDEAHYIKNPAAKRTAAIRTWTQRAERALYLSGTPMENRVEEFRNLVSYLQPELAAQLSTRPAVGGAEKFRRAVAPVYLRRNQEDVLSELPDLIRTDEWLEFGDQDAAAYRSAVLAGNFMAMRRAAFAPGVPAGSAKLQRLREIVHESAANRRKIVVFSYFRDVVETVSRCLDGAVHGPLTGSVPPRHRQEVVDRFTRTSGHAVLLSQIQAGGVGLNLQAASVVILCEPQVKPTLEDQAVARVHRLGQVRGVQLHRLLVADSADERMLDILEHKTELFNDYARRSDVAAATPDAVDVSEVDLARKVVAMEQERLAAEDIAQQHAGDTWEPDQA